MQPDRALLTLPNALSALRGILGLAIVWLISEGGISLLTVALVLMLAAEGLGLVTHRMGRASPIGEIAAALFGSVYHLTVFVGFLAAGWLPAWMLFVLFFPDLALTYVRTFARQSGHDLDPGMADRIKAVVHALAQLGIVGLALAGGGGEPAGAWVLLFAAMAASLSALVDRATEAGRRIAP